MSESITARGGSLREHVAEEVRVALARRRMSASRLAKELGVSQTYVWRRLSGETAFDLDDLEKIAKVLRVSIVDLLPKASTTVTEAKPDTHAGSLTRGRPPGRADRSVRPGGVRRPTRMTPPIAA
jgi:transcriptional regulator with XRE-family HTH domain